MSVREELPTVLTPSGVEIEVLNEKEKEYYEKTAKKYLEQYSFENAADLTALETLLTCQLLIYRFNTFITLGVDNEGNPVEVNPLIDNINKLSQRIAQLLDTLQISRKSRTSEAATPAEIINKILQKAKEYGLKKNEVAWKFLQAYYYIRSLVNVYYRMNDRERSHFQLKAEDVIRKIKATLDELDEIEEEFKKKRSLWITTIRGD